MIWCGQQTDAPCRKLQAQLTVDQGPLQDIHWQHQVPEETIHTGDPIWLMAYYAHITQSYEKLESWDLDLFKWREVIKRLLLESCGFKVPILSGFLNLSLIPRFQQQGPNGIEKLEYLTR